MEATSIAEQKRLYSWLCDNYVFSKNSKWLQENITAMDIKIKAMVRIIEEDADSFARRAEMYFKKRPDLMKLVEEFYRAYRALMERYDRVTGALLQAHRTIAVVFPNVQLMLPDEPPFRVFESSNEDTCDFDMPPQSIIAQWDGKSLDAIAALIIKEGLKHFSCLFPDQEAQNMFGESLLKKILNSKEHDFKDDECKVMVEEASKLSKENKNLQNHITIESMHANKAEVDLQVLKDAIAELKSELEAVVSRYQASQERISCLEYEISERQEALQQLSDEMSIKVSKLNIAEERCLALGKKHASLQWELDKLNQVVSRQQEEVSDCFKENQNLHSRAYSESKRADEAEVESIRLKDVISKLQCEMESALLQYHVSQEKVADLEAEISGSKEQLISTCADLSIEASKLKMTEDQCLFLQEENKYLHKELEKCMLRVTKQEEEITMREEELHKLQESFEADYKQKMHAERKEKSMQLEINELKEVAERQEEELEMKKKELDKLTHHIEDECAQRLHIEREHQLLVELHIQSEEKMKLLDLEIQDRTEKLGIVELHKSALEDEIKHLCKENNDLIENRASSASKIAILQDEITSLRLSMHKFEDELRCHVNEKTSLNQKISSLKNEKNDFAEAFHELTDNLRRMELRGTGLEKELQRLQDENLSLNEKKVSSFSKIVSLQDEVISLSESKHRLQDGLQLHSEEKEVLQQELISLKNERNDLEERHHELVEQIEEVNSNVISLQAFVMDLHDGNKEHKTTFRRYEHEKTFHLEQLSLMGSMMEKKLILDNSLSDAKLELQCFLEKVKGLEEYCRSLHDNVLSIMSTKPMIVPRVAIVNPNMENILPEKSFSDLNVAFEILGGKLKALEEACQSLFYKEFYLIAENNNVISKVETVGLHLQSLHNLFLNFKGKNMNQEETDQAVEHIDELNSLLSSCNKEHTDHTCSFKSRTSYLSNHIRVLKEENQIIKEELEEEHQKAVMSDIVNFVLKHCLNDMNEKILFLSEQCAKYLEKFMCAENVLVALKDEWASKGKRLISQSNHSEKLLERIQLMMKAYETKEACKHGTDLVTKDETCSNLESVFLHGNTHEIMDMDLYASKEHEEMLMIELEFLSGRLFDLQEANHAFECEIMKLHEENEFLLQTLYELRERNNQLESENLAIVENATAQEHLSLIFKSCNAEKDSEIECLVRDVKCLYRATNDFGQAIRLINKRMKALEAENLHLKEEHRTHIGCFEDKIQKTRKFLGKSNQPMDEGMQSKRQRYEQPLNRGNRLQGIQSTAIQKDPKEPVVEINKLKGGREDLEKYLHTWSEHSACKYHEIEFQSQSNEMLMDELHKLCVIVETLKTNEDNLTYELQVVTENYRFHKEESEKLHGDLLAASIMGLVLMGRFVELLQTVGSLETTDALHLKTPIEEISLGNVREGDFKEKLYALERENKGLKSELNAYVPLVASLEREMASLEEKTLALTNLHILNSKKKQGHLLASLQRKKGIQMRGKKHNNSPRTSAAIMELKKMHAKVKVLQKEVTDTERLLDKENMVSVANLEVATAKGKARKTFSRIRLVEEQKKKDFALGLEKCVDSGKSARLLRDEDTYSRVMHEHMMKDIELDHVLSSFRCEPSFHVESDHHALPWKPETENDIFHHVEKVDVERCEKPPEVVLEKEFFDDLDVPADCSELFQEWFKRFSGDLSADGQRLLALEKWLKELRVKTEASELKCQPSASVLSTIKMQVKEAEGTITKLFDVNYKLTRMAENLSMSSDSKKSRKKALQQFGKASEKISGLELKLQKIQTFLSNLQNEQQEGKVSQGFLARKPRLPLKDLIYGKRSDLKPKRRRFYACMSLQRNDSNLI